MVINERQIMDPLDVTLDSLIEDEILAALGFDSDPDDSEYDDGPDSILIDEDWDS